MDRFFVGVVVGIVISTIGMSGMAKVVDNGIDMVKAQSRELSR